MNKNEEIFEKYYKENKWGQEETKSGSGSTIEATKNIVNELPFLFKKYKIASILDCGCGDFNWFKNVDIRQMRYLGIDIVQEMIDENQKKFGSKNVNFEKVDFFSETIKQADLVIVKDVFIHYPNKVVIEAIRKIKKSGSRYLLTTSFLWKHAKHNTEIELGGFRPINLTEYPFNLPMPKEVIIIGDKNSRQDKCLCLWELKDIFI